MLTSELLSVIDEYVEGVISLEQLEDWLVPRLPVLFRLPLADPEAADLAAALELGLAEMSDQTRTEGGFRSMLREILRSATSLAISYPVNAFNSTQSSNQTVTVPTIQRASSVLVISRT